MGLDLTPSRTTPSTPTDVLTLPLNGVMCEGTCCTTLENALWQAWSQRDLNAWQGTTLTHVVVRHTPNHTSPGEMLLFGCNLEATRFTTWASSVTRDLGYEVQGGPHRVTPMATLEAPPTSSPHAWRRQACWGALGCLAGGGAMLWEHWVAPLPMPWLWLASILSGLLLAALGRRYWWNSARSMWPILPPLLLTWGLASLPTVLPAAWLSPPTFHALWLVTLALAAVVTVACTWQRRHRMHMGVTVTLAFGLAWSVGVVHMLWPGSWYYLPIHTHLTHLALMVGLVHLTQALQQRFHTTKATPQPTYGGGLTSSFPTSLQRVRGHTLETIACNAIAVGDVIRVPPDTTCPVDGVPITTVEVDAEALNGQTYPITCSAGGEQATLFAGMRPKHTSVDVRVTAVGNQTQWSRTQAKLRLLPYLQRPTTPLTQRVMTYVIPVLMTVGLITPLLGALLLPHGGLPALGWMITVLLSCCPCVFAMAGPVPEAMGRAALQRLGFDVLTHNALDQLANVRGACFDKTGTLTTSKNGSRDEDERLQPHTKTLLRWLQNQEGIACHVLTGDRRLDPRTQQDRTLAHCQALLGGVLPMEQLHTGLKPDEKARRLRDLRNGSGAVGGQQLAGPILMVGNGNNDAAVMAEADVSVSMGHCGPDTYATSDLYMHHDPQHLKGTYNLLRLQQALVIARRVRRCNRFNVGMALTYNAVMVPMAAGGWYALTGHNLAPMVGCWGMLLATAGMLATGGVLKWSLPSPSSLEHPASSTPQPAVTLPVAKAGSRRALTPQLELRQRAAV